MGYEEQARESMATATAQTGRLVELMRGGQSDEAMDAAIEATVTAIREGVAAVVFALLFVGEQVGEAAAATRRR
jgi:enoyl reductase-like protein